MTLCRQRESVVQCETRISGQFAVGLSSRFSPVIFVIVTDSLTEHISKEASWYNMFTEYVVLCDRDKDVLEVELEQ